MHKIIKERLQLIIGHAFVIEERISSILDAADSLKSSRQGEILLDSLITPLQALSENIKRIQKTDSRFFAVSLPVNVGPGVRFRDPVSHHYESLNHEIIYAIAKNKFPR